MAWRGSKKRLLRGYRKALRAQAEVAQERDESDRAFVLYGEAAELGDGEAAWQHGSLTFGERDWHQWWNFAAVCGVRAYYVVSDVCVLFGSPVWDGLGRILFVVAPVLNDHLNVTNQKAFGVTLTSPAMATLLRMIAVYETHMGAARCAIDCWSMVGLRR